MEIKTFYFNELRTCCYILSDETKECVIIDPGCASKSEHDRFIKYVETNGLKPVALLNTHGHFDHVMGNNFVMTTWDVKLYISEKDVALLKKAKSYGEYFGYQIEDIPEGDNIITISDNDIIKFGNSELKVIASPGHTPGGVAFYSQSGNVLFSGDSLFAGSIGRTDLPGGDLDQLMDSLENKLLKLDGQCKVLPGHGPESTIGIEIETNPFLRF